MCIDDSTDCAVMYPQRTGAIVIVHSRPIFMSGTGKHYEREMTGRVCI